MRSPHNPYSCNSQPTQSFSIHTCTFNPVYLGDLSRVHVIDIEPPSDATGDDLPPIRGEAGSEHWEVFQVEALKLGIGVTIDLCGDTGEGRSGSAEEVGSDGKRMGEGKWVVRGKSRVDEGNRQGRGWKGVKRIKTVGGL